MPCTVHRVSVCHRSSGNEEAIAVTVGVSDVAAHLAENLVFKDRKDGRHFVGVHARIQRVRYPLCS